MGIHMSQTRVSCEQTAAAMHSELAKMKANRIMTEFDDGQPVAISFTIQKNGALLNFKLPIRIDGVSEAMRRTKSKGWRDPTKVKNVAWRIAYRWLQSQLTMIEIGMVEPAEVFLPYYQTDALGTTLWQRMVEDGRFLPLPKDA